MFQNDSSGIAKIRGIVPHTGRGEAGRRVGEGMFTKTLLISAGSLIALEKLFVLVSMVADRRFHSVDTWPD